ncbi:MAG: hypothetical protein JST79_03685 [Acidobacteria bacterium]|nr:hypothetical protein [Acidobacteriota bacterium]
MNDIPEPRVQNYFVSGAEVFLLVKGTENASKGKVVLKNEQGEAIGELPRIKGEIRDYIARFSKDGSYKGGLKLDLPVEPIQLAAFPEGGFLIAGIDKNNKVPKVVLLDDSGQLQKFIDLPKDISNKPAYSEDYALAGKSQPVDVVSLFAQFIGVKDGILFARGFGASPIYKIGPGGEVESLKLKLPKGMAMTGMLPSDGSWLIELGNADPGKPFYELQSSLYEADPDSGALLRRFSVKNSAKEGIACFHDGKFLGVGHVEGKLILLRGEVLPAQ